MRQAATVTVLPTAEPILLAEAKNWCKVDGTEDDALIARLITAAVETCENETKRKPITQTIKLTLDAGRSEVDNVLGDGVYEMATTMLSGSLPRAIDLPFPPVQAISSVVTYNSAGTSATMDSSYYEIDTAGGRFLLKQSASWPSDLRDVKSCEITYTAGYGSTSASVPSALITAMLQHIKEMYDNRGICDASDGVSGIYRRHRHYG